jgi:hypothetical protein
MGLSSDVRERIKLKELCLVDSAGNVQFTLKVEEHRDQRGRVPTLVIADKRGTVRGRLVAYDEGQDRKGDPETYLEIGSWSSAGRQS